MHTLKQFAIVITLLLLTAASSEAQFGGVLDKLKKGSDKAKKVSDATTPWTPEQEKAIGEASAAKLIHVFGLYKNPKDSNKADKMHLYVNDVGYALTQHAASGSRLTYKFGILDTEAITAFGLPGGYVFVTRGALANIKDESELAGVLAHEIAHVDNRHLEKEVQAKKMTGLATSEGMDVATAHLGSAAPVGELLKKIANEVITQAVTRGYSRDKEEEADKKGTELAVTAGYTPEGLRNFLATLQAVKTDSAQDKRRMGVWGGTHPPLDQRVTTLTGLAAKFSGGQDLAERFDDNANFGKSKKELAKEEEERKAKEAADKEAAAKARSKSSTSKSKSSGTTKKKPQ